MPRALIILLRGALGRRWGVRAARIYAVMVSISATATIWILVRAFGPDLTTVSLVARSSALLTWIAGGIAALSLAAPPKDAALALGIAALASSRGHDDKTIARAEMAATIRLLGEVIVVPVAGIALFVSLIIAGGRLDGAIWPILGSVLFGVVAAALLGIVTSACRRWGGPRGRTLLMVVVLVPWILSEALLPMRGAQLLSLPGLLGRIWQTLTAGVA
jgi:hypothetical protein